VQESPLTAADRPGAPPREGDLRPRRPLRLALPHRRARRPRVDAAVPDRSL